MEIKVRCAQVTKGLNNCTVQLTLLNLDSTPANPSGAPAMTPGLAGNTVVLNLPKSAFSEFEPGTDYTCVFTAIPAK